MEDNTNSKNIEKVMNSILTPKYPELSFEVDIYKDRDSLTFEHFIQTNIRITAPKGFYKTKAADDIYYDNVENDIRDILKMFGIFRHVYPNWYEDYKKYYREY